ncbi:MAG: acylphosphatase [Acidobacteriota bacterium]|nr:acylphosphatase [Acidobacteriota bacterium]MDQ7086856.1 acylphosphatase [Acidobacteriota bacterium]
MKLARRYVVHGTVQGVGYRFFTCTCADALGVCGWVKNLPDGTVAVHAEGDEEQLKEFEFDLSRGARYARVSRVESEEAEFGDHPDFKIRR